MKKPEGDGFSIHIGRDVGGVFIVRDEFFATKELDSEKKVTVNIENLKQRRISPFCIVSVLKNFLPHAQHIGQPFIVRISSKGRTCIFLVRVFGISLFDIILEICFKNVLVWRRRHVGVSINHRGVWESCLIVLGSCDFRSGLGS
jgi:hypothetical protein